MMRSIRHLGNRPMSLPLSADDIIEFHLARLLLLLNVCGVAGRIDGLTKMAKLDFFVRYPEFFDVARRASNGEQLPVPASTERTVESAMVRHHYGPWDKRYYQILAHLEAKQLITVSKEGKSYRIALTQIGRERANALAARPSYTSLVERMREVKQVFGSKTGNSLKALIYEVFETEVRQRPMGEVIES
jgi:DNA-binding PadR family transcriptional regulator